MVCVSSRCCRSCASSLRMEGYTEQEIADSVGYKTASAVHKRIAKIANAYEDYVTAEYQRYLDK